MGHSSLLAAALVLVLGVGAARAEEPAKSQGAAPPAKGQTAATPAPGQGAEEPSKPADKAPPADAAKKLDHRFQVGLGVRAGTGYRVIMPYNEEFCGQEKKSVCGSRQPAWIELSPSFGITRALEVLFDVRFSLEDDFTETKSLFFSPGIKYYAGAEDLFKFYFTGQVVFDLQEQLSSKAAPSDFDVGLRSALGVQFDIIRYVGLFAQGGVTVGFKRWLTFVVDFAGGVQVRY